MKKRGDAIVKALIGVMAIFCLPIIGNVWGLDIPEPYQEARAMTMVVGGKAAPAGEEEETCSDPCVFSSSWAGSDSSAENTNGGAGHVFSGSDITASKLVKGTTSNAGWNGTESKYLSFIGDGTNMDYVYVTLGTKISQIGIRVAFYIATDFTDAGQTAYGVQIYSTDYTSGFGILRFDRGASSTNVTWLVKDKTTENYTVVGTPIDVSASTWYQAVMTFTGNTLNGGTFQLWDADGSDQVGTTQTYSGTTFDVGNFIDTVRVGSVYSPSEYSSFAFRMDILKVTNTAAGIAKRTP